MTIGDRPRQDGIEQEKVAVARKVLQKQMQISEILFITDLSVAEIESLKKKQKAT
ncbi:MAG: hypothetical protein HRU36_03000 [Rickettsiales bacterium]|nr:hypothetical protein [Rickettsiales bacterium]